MDENTKKHSKKDNEPSAPLDRSDLRPLSTETGKEVKPCSQDQTVPSRASNAPASVRTAALGQPQFHNPDNLPSPGGGYRFLVKGEKAEPPDEYWNGSIWRRVTHRHDDTSTCTYRTSASRPLPDATGEGEDVKEIRALLPTTPPASGETAPLLPSQATCAACMGVFSLLVDGSVRCDCGNTPPSYRADERGAWEAAIAGALRSAIDAHGNITKENLSSAAKRVVGIAKQWRQEELTASRAECEALRQKVRICPNHEIAARELDPICPWCQFQEANTLRSDLTANLAREKAEGEAKAHLDDAHERSRECDRYHRRAIDAESALTTARARIAELERERDGLIQAGQDQWNEFRAEGTALRSALDAVTKERDGLQNLRLFDAELFVKWGKERDDAIAQLAAANADRAIVDWLSLRHVEVREPLLHGSRELFTAFADNSDEEDDIKPSNLRALVAAALANPTPASTAEGQ